MSEVPPVLYGSVDAAIGHTRSQDGSRITVSSGQAASSRLGLSGRETLGAGVEAVFNLEAGFEVDTGAGAGARNTLAWDRQSWVGLAGRYGSLSFGRQYRPQTRAVLVTDPFDGASVASPPNTYAALSFRRSDALVYESPQVGHWQLLAMVAPRESGGSARPDLGYALLYRAGPLRAAYGWDHRAGDGTPRREHSLGAAYELRGLTLYGAWRERAEGTRLDERSHWIGISLPLGRVTLRGVVGGTHERRARPVTTGLGLGFEYRLSQRTDLYGRYATLRNRDGATADLGERPAGAAPQALALGLRWRF